MARLPFPWRYQQYINIDYSGQNAFLFFSMEHHGRKCLYYAQKELKKAIVLLEIHMKFRYFTRVKCQSKHLYASEYLRSISTFGSHSDIFILEFFMEAWNKQWGSGWKFLLFEFKLFGGIQNFRIRIHIIPNSSLGLYFK